MKDLVLVIDMQNAYKTGQTWGCQDIETVTGNIARLLEQVSARDKQAQTADSYPPIAFTRHIPFTTPVGTWKEYNKKYDQINANPQLSQIMDEFTAYTERYPVFNKSAFSALSAPALERTLSHYSRIVITGVVAQCCVLSTVLGVIDKGVQLIYLKDAVAGENNELKLMTETIVKSFSPIHTDVMSVDDYLSGHE